MVGVGVGVVVRGPVQGFRVQGAQEGKEERWSSPQRAGRKCHPVESTRHRFCIWPTNWPWREAGTAWQRGGAGCQLLASSRNTSLSISAPTQHSAPEPQHDARLLTVCKRETVNQSETSTAAHQFGGTLKMASKLFLSQSYTRAVPPSASAS